MVVVVDGPVEKLLDGPEVGSPVNPVVGSLVLGSVAGVDVAGLVGGCDSPCSLFKQHFIRLAKYVCNIKQGLLSYKCHPVLEINPAPETTNFGQWW